MSRDPLEQLGRAWRELEPPPATPELDELDPQTRAAVDWMAQAWRELILNHEYFIIWQQLVKTWN